MLQVTDKAYQEHRVFDELQRFSEFYASLSMSIFSYPTMGTKAIANIDTYVYSSMQGTVESMKCILFSGRINDAYTLMRKFYDSAMINIYTNIFIHNNFNIESFIIDKINNWLQGKEKLPEYRVMSQYIKSSVALKPINDILEIDNRYKLLRARCNDHTHYNFYRHAMLNDNEIYIDGRQWWLDQFSNDIQDIFILHFGYIFFLKNHYMMSSDYFDALECGVQPEENSEFWVAPFIQEVFDDVITPRRPEITLKIKESSAMNLI